MPGENIMYPSPEGGDINIKKSEGGLNTPNKNETQHAELINSQKDHKRRTGFVYIGPKVCQLRTQGQA